MKQIKRFVAVMCLFALMGQGCTKGPSREAVQLSQEQRLTVWAVIDDVDAYEDLLNTFRVTYPYVDIRFRRFRLEEYEHELLNAMAEDRGPDIFMVHNTWVNKYLSKISPQPPSVKVAQQVVTGTVRKQVSLQVRDVKTISPVKVRNEFADVAAADGVRTINVSTDPREPDYQDRVLALPMSVDTLALYYNKDIMNAAGVATPPETWDQFQEQVRKLVLVNSAGDIIQAGAGFGTGANVERSPDIISLLMMQNRTEMATDRGQIVFHETPAEIRKEVEIPPGMSALYFYTDFANPAKNVYTWNLDQPNSLDAFIQGTSAFFLGYSYHLPLIRANAPKLNLGITQVPQIAGNREVNYANYWMWTVSKKSESTDIAWHLLNYLTSAENAPTYLEMAKRPAARKALLEDQLEDEDLGVFASQVLTAKSWYRGYDPAAMERAMIDMVDEIVEGEVEIKDAIGVAARKVSQTMRAPKIE